ncbi:MAG: prolyl-tRNA synthetase associated domain-containing protein [Clostridium sp.]|jgi:Ala-tRNA(Pro) deacylase|uniref:prolyl-tRNA synthetase associated domain-containing protein n=1 Tax=Clostridium sp. TaxID=1506 RepID=UPI0025BAF2CA|nr:prolyl-tRNA synthetase associated domain-containing protein [Clostridium sp.]MCH3963926.1 prolyl-tRNA synthetase associated domain-containing protein [Clostridium sp.]MCI1716127.1 prolyl-tRNA synthetase associated domain-containing protein [Clostridium sp.]MCI1800633.1 prolyl-tRNA synthetase associated domain-containing protein [Clostridium sp.]MCI1814304.1 prolyl-tRNA synthetase associated domain-containing protein [Clostridium sp.]MCI1871203.1 prolyl-tRNA synthetase associated domain-cont
MSKIYIDPTIYTTKPSGSRLSKEMAVYNLLEKLDIPYIRIDHDATASIDDCHDVDKLLDITICKNLFLCNSRKNNFYLLMISGNKRFKAKELSSQIQSSRLSFAPAEYMEKYLDITPGSVSVMGLMNDTGHKVRLLIDEDVIKEEYLGCHPCINTSSLKIMTKNIIDKFLPYTGHSPEYVKLTGE